MNLHHLITTAHAQKIQAAVTRLDSEHLMDADLRDMARDLEVIIGEMADVDLDKITDDALNTSQPFTLFWDMNSGGGQKEEWSLIYIEADEDTACRIFYGRFGHSPHRVSCTCCGPDYSVTESSSFEQASGFHRNCDYDRETQQFVEKEKPASTLLKTTYALITPEQHREDRNVLVITAEEIAANPQWDTGDQIPDQGYVWVD